MNIAEEVIGKYKGNFFVKVEENKTYDSEMRIFTFNPKNKLFLAEGNDQFGDSAIIGAICLDSLMIKFDKYYFHEKQPFPLNFSSGGSRGMFYEPMFRKIQFQGIFGPPPLNFGGTYFYPGAEEPGGAWEMIKVEK